MQNQEETICPGCGLGMPTRSDASYDGYFNCSAECWSVFTEVVGYEFEHPAQVWSVHQLTVDSYAVQHAGGEHPDKSVVVHLCGLHLALDRHIPCPEIAPLLKRLADRISDWPHFPAPDTRGLLTVLEVALADSSQEHVRLVREWAGSVWGVWRETHQAVGELVTNTLGWGAERT